MSTMALYPLRFDPIFEYRLWGGRGLGRWMNATLPGNDPIGEAWILSDRVQHASRVADGPLKGKTIGELMTTSKDALLGSFADRFDRFPLLLKFLDVQKMLSVQVHPQDDRADLLPEGETGKTESWLVLETAPGGRIYAGLRPGTTAADLRALTAATADDHLTSFAPEVGQAVLIPAGTVHALGDGVMVFEVQENSDVTFRLFDWDHVDAKTGKPRDLQVDRALACVDLDQGAVTPVVPQATPTGPTSGPSNRRLCVSDSHFEMYRTDANEPFAVGAAAEPRILVCVGGSGVVEHVAGNVALAQGAVVLLPAEVGVCRFTPTGSVALLEIAIPHPQ